MSVDAAPAPARSGRVAAWRARVAESAFAALVTLLALAVAFAITAIFISASGASVREALDAVLDGAFGSRPQTANTLAKLTPLVLCALGWIVAFTAKRVNIGLEGQALMGALGATVVGLSVDVPAVVHLPLAVLGGAVAGGAWAGIAAWLWARRGVNEIISTLLLNFLALQLVAWMLRGPISEGASDFVRTEPVRESAWWPTLLVNTPLTWDLVLVPLAVLAVVVMLRRTTFGFRLRFTGANHDAAAVAGIATTRVASLALVASGALAGLAGSSLVLAGQTHTLTDNITAGVGYSGIVAALLANGSAVLAVPAALLLAVLAQGGGLMEARTGVSAQVTGVLQGLVIVLVAGSAFLVERRRRRRVDRPEHAAAAAADGRSPGADGGDGSDRAGAAPTEDPATGSGVGLPPVGTGRGAG